ncbi:mitotic checkpoint protein BUB3.3 isoform X2 [Cucumis melo var. makuwa]|uniref:Mitotic checkpoint protein BUB3.3 isoform X2 n=1 Tax=Cucumis melo var. makuwa TaxID=1194695 RepID=A0A5A7TCB0_CUCMM|nr:mitotic checkpoint protein BUB3.3 isoform X2 [Cucumis melo var. makuwa]
MYCDQCNQGPNCGYLSYRGICVKIVNTLFLGRSTSSSSIKYKFVKLQSISSRLSTVKVLRKSGPKLFSVLCLLLLLSSNSHLRFEESTVSETGVSLTIEIKTGESREIVISLLSVPNVGFPAPPPFPYSNKEEWKKEVGIEPDVNRTRNLLIWSQTRYHCATDPLHILRLHDVDKSTLRLEVSSGTAMLDCCFQDESLAFNAASDGCINYAIQMLYLLVNAAFESTIAFLFNDCSLFTLRTFL